jgi:hypothetical protein
VREGVWEVRKGLVESVTEGEVREGGRKLADRVVKGGAEIEVGNTYERN